jgi:hypothetical protein
MKTHECFDLMFHDDESLNIRDFNHDVSNTSSLHSVLMLAQSGSLSSENEAQLA